MSTAAVPTALKVLTGRLVERLRRALSQFLAIPLLVVLAFIVLAFAAHLLDVRAGGAGHWGPLWSYFGRYVGDASSATSSLLAIRRRLSYFEFDNFSILLLAVQQGAPALNSQIIDSYLRRRPSQVYFGCFAGVFARP